MQVSQHFLPFFRRNTRDFSFAERVRFIVFSHKMGAGNLQTGINCLTFQCQHPEYAFVHPSKGLFGYEALKAFKP